MAIESRMCVFRKRHARRLFEVAPQRLTTDRFGDGLSGDRAFSPMPRASLNRMLGFAVITCRR